MARDLDLVLLVTPSMLPSMLLSSPLMLEEPSNHSHVCVAGLAEDQWPGDATNNNGELATIYTFKPQ